MSFAGQGLIFCDCDRTIRKAIDDDWLISQFRQGGDELEGPNVENAFGHFVRGIVDGQVEVHLLAACGLQRTSGAQQVSLKI